jgi:hypothetical protein
MPVTLDDFVNALDASGCKPKRRGTEWYAKCPVHGGRDSDSLSATEREGKLLVRCHSQKCSFMDILGALGLDPESTLPPRPPPARKKDKVEPSELKQLAIYDYTDESGYPLFQVLKYQKPDGSKTFRQRKPDGKGGWEWKLGRIPRVLYNLQEVSKAIRDGRTIFVVEGEKDVETIRNHGMVATCNPGGACTKDESWKAEWVDALAGARVVILPDNDDPGEVHGQIVLRRLYGKARTVRIVHLPGLDIGEDVSNWIEKGHTAYDLQQAVRGASNFPICTLAEFMQMDIPKRPWVVDGLLKRGDLIEVHSWRGTGKTQFAIGMALSVSAGSQMFHWKAPEPKSVVYVEGEMAIDEIRGRLLKQGAGMNVTDEQYKMMFDNFILLQHEALKQHGVQMRTLSSIEGLNDLECFMADLIEFTSKNPSLLILDNLSCLHGGDENDATTWEGLKEFMIRMRVMGVCVMVIHHSGKAGASRGHSTLEDQLDVVLKLEGKKYKSEEGAKFDVKFEKARGLTGKQAKNFTAHMQDGEDGLTSAWFKVEPPKKIVDMEKVEQVGQLRKEGWSYDNIALELGMSKHTAMKLAKQYKENV